MCVLGTCFEYVMWVYVLCVSSHRVKVCFGCVFSTCGFECVARSLNVTRVCAF